MIRFLFSFLGAVYTFITLGLIGAAMMVGAIFWMYARDLPITTISPATSPRPSAASIPAKGG